MTDEHLFEPPPPERGGKKRPVPVDAAWHEIKAHLPATRDLYGMYLPPSMDWTLVGEDFTRVLHWLRTEFEERVRAEAHPGDPRHARKAVFSRIRKEHAHQMVALADEHSVLGFGEPRHVQHAKKDPRPDAANTDTRWYLMGVPRPLWAVWLHDAALCARHGYQLPPAMYATQGSIERLQAPPAAPPPAPPKRPEGMW